MHQLHMMNCCFTSVCVYVGTTENVHAVLNSKALPLLIRGELRLCMYAY